MIVVIVHIYPPVTGQRQTRLLLDDLHTFHIVKMYPGFKLTSSAAVRVSRKDQHCETTNSINW